MNDFVELRRYIIIVLRRWWVLALAALITAALGYSASQRQPRTYEATTTIMIGQPIQATNLADLDFKTGEQLARTYADIALRQPVLQGVVTVLDLSDSWQALQQRVRVDTVPGTQLIEITVEAGSPEDAVSIADEIAQQLILLSATSSRNEQNDEDQSFVRQRINHLRERLESAETRLDSLDQALADPTLSSVESQALINEIGFLENLIASWENNYAQLLLLTGDRNSPNDLTVIEPAQVNPGATRPNITLNTLLAAVIGLMLALGVIVLLEYLDDRIKSVDDLSRVAGLVPMGTISKMKGEHELVTLLQPFSSVTESYRMVRSNIQLRSADEAGKAIMVTSAIDGEGKSMTVANLGVVMAQAGLRTVIVDADFRRPMQHEIFQMPLKGGVTDLLRWPELELDEYLKDTQVARLRMLTSGELPPNPSELLGSQRMGQLLADLKEVADIVIFDSPPATIVADAVDLSKHVDGVLLVVEANRTHRDVVRQAIFNLQQAGGNVLGAVLNKMPGPRWGSHGSYYAPRLPASESPLERTGLQSQRLQQLQLAGSSRDNLNGNGRSKNGRDKVVFSFTNSKGKTYFLHKSSTTAGKNRHHTLYFFASEIRDNPLTEIPAGYQVYESRSGLPVLKKAD